MKQTGGSVASDAVTTLVSADTYAKLNSTFTNNYSNNGGQCGGANHICPTCGGAYAKKKSKSKDSKKLEKKKGGADSGSLFQNIMSSMAPKSHFANNAGIFKSQQANALTSPLLKNVGMNVKSHFNNSSTNSTPTLINSKSEFMSLDPTKIATAAPVMSNGGAKKIIKVMKEKKEKKRDGEKKKSRPSKKCQK
jgi:hypothetical protein